MKADGFFFRRQSMLEQRSLLIAAPVVQADAAGKSWIRGIIEPDSGRFLGQATCGGGQGWFAWLRGQTIRVFETEDASLVMTLTHPWVFSRTWEVRDADDRRVGLVYGNGLWSAQGERLFVVEEYANDSLRFMDTARREAATAKSSDAGETLLT